MIYLLNSLTLTRFKTYTWVGAYNKDCRKFKIATNMSKDKCKMTVKNTDVMLYNLSPLEYTAGDLKRLIQFLEASCSIPGYVPHKIIDNHSYVDGGVVCASPVSYFKSSLVDLAREHKKSVHFMLSTCEDLNLNEGGVYRNADKDDSGMHLVQSMMDIVTNMLNVSLVRDRVACNDVLTSLGSTLIGTVCFKADQQNMLTLKEFKAKEGSECGTVTEMFCAEVKSYMDMSNFDGEMCLRHKKYADENMVCRLWVYANSTTCNDVLGSCSLGDLRRGAYKDTLPN